MMSAYGNSEVQPGCNNGTGQPIPLILGDKPPTPHPTRNHALDSAETVTLARLSAARIDPAPAGLGDKAEFRGIQRTGESRWQASAPHTRRTATVRYVADQASSC